MKRDPLTQQTLDVVARHNACWAAADLPGLYALYAADIRFTDHYSGATHAGAAVREHVADMIRRSAVGAIRYLDGIRADGDTATLQYLETIASPDGTAVLEVSACDLVRVRDGLIVSIDEYAIPRRQADGRHAGGNSGAEKIGLSPRALGFLLRDLDDYLAREQPYLNPTLSLADVASATGYSRNQVSYALNQALGMSFYEYINRARVSHLLADLGGQRRLSLDALARAAGFRSLSTFHEAFKAHTGKTPRKYFAGL